MVSIDEQFNISLGPDSWPLNQAFCVATDECRDEYFSDRCSRLCSNKSKSSCDSSSTCSWKKWYNVCKPKDKCKTKICSANCALSKNECDASQDCDWVGLNCEHAATWAALEKEGKINLCVEKCDKQKCPMGFRYYCANSGKNETICSDLKDAGFDLVRESNLQDTQWCKGMGCESATDYVRIESNISKNETDYTWLYVVALIGGSGIGYYYYYSKNK